MAKASNNTVVFLSHAAADKDLVETFETRECLATRIDRKLNSTAVIDVLTDLFVLRGMPGHVRSDNGPEFIAKAVRDWIAAVGGQDGLHQTGLAMGERLLRELQLQAPR